MGFDDVITKQCPHCNEVIERRCAYCGRVLEPLEDKCHCQIERSWYYRQKIDSNRFNPELARLLTKGLPCG